MHAWASSHSISLAETLENVFNGMFRCLVTERKQHRDSLRHLGAVVPEIDAISASNTSSQATQDSVTNCLLYRWRVNNSSMAKEALGDHADPSLTSSRVLGRVARRPRGPSHFGAI